MTLRHRTAFFRHIEHPAAVRFGSAPCFGEPSLHAAFVGAPYQRGFARATQAWRRLMRTECHAAFRVSLKTGHTASASSARRPNESSAHRSGGGAAVSRDAKCAEEALLRREVAQIAKQLSARAKRSGRKAPRMRRGISARDGTLDGAPNERRMEGGIPETAPRHSDGWAISFRNVRGTRYSDAVRIPRQSQIPASPKRSPSFLPLT